MSLVEPAEIRIYFASLFSAYVGVICLDHTQYKNQ